MKTKAQDPVPLVIGQVSYLMILVSGLALGVATPAYPISTNLMTGIYAGLFAIFLICSLGIWGNLRAKSWARWSSAVFFLLVSIACLYDFLSLFDKGLEEGKRHLWSAIFAALFFYLASSFAASAPIKAYFSRASRTLK